MEDPEVQCNDCGWQGDASELQKIDDVYTCPDCDSLDIEDYEE